MSVLNNKSHEALVRDHEATHMLLLNDDLWLRLVLGLLLDDHLRLGLNNNSGTSAHTSSHSDELCPHADPTAIAHLDALLTCTVLSKDTQGNISFTDDLSGVTLVLDDDMHIVLEHISLDFHELQLPMRVLATVVGRLTAVVLLADIDVTHRRHLVESTADFVVKFRSENVKFE